jgi:hypothetical protein
MEYRNRTTITQTIKKSDILYFMSTGNYEEFSRLITEANVNDIIDTKNGYRALDYAIRFDNEKMITYLLNMGANPYLKNLSKEDAFDLSLKYHTKYVIVHQLNDAKEINKELQRTITSLNRKVNDVETNNKFLVKSIDELVLTNNILKTEISDIKKEHLILRNKNASLLEDNSSLRLAKTSLETKNVSLKRDFDKMNEEVFSLKKENETLLTEQKSTKVKYDNLYRSYKGLLKGIEK